MSISQINNKMIVKSVLVIIVIAVLGLVVHKYLQFRTVKMEKLRVEQVREEEKQKEEAEVKKFRDIAHRCDGAKEILDMVYKDGLLSINLDCANIGDVFEEISKKIKVEVIPPRSGAFRVPISFSNLSIKDGLDILGKNTGFGYGSHPDDTIYIARYHPDKNIWSFDEVIIEVKDPPENGVTHIVRGKDSYDFVRADGTNKRSYEILDFSQIKKSSNDKFVVIDKYYSRGNEEFIVLNNQGDIQWKFKISDNLIPNYTLSNNGKYLVVTQDDEAGCYLICKDSSYIFNEKGIKEIKSLIITTIAFSEDGKFFIANNYQENLLDVFDDQGNEIHTKKSLEEVKKLVPALEKIEYKF